MSRKVIRSQGISQASMNEIHLKAEWREREHGKKQKDKNKKANKTKMPRTKAIKTKRSAVSLETRVHRSKTDMTMSFWLRSGWVASEADSEKMQARHQAGLRVRRWSFERTGLGRLGDTDDVFTECEVKEGMKHHLRSRNNWSIAAQTQWDPQPAVSTRRSQPGGQELQRVVEKERDFCVLSCLWSWDSC